MSFWRKEEPIIDPVTKDIVRGGMFEPQRRWWDSDKFIKVMVTGVGGGKTFIGAKRAISMAIYNAPIPFMAVSPTYDMAVTTIIPTIMELLEGKQLPYTFNQKKNLFSIQAFGHTAHIWIRSGDRPDKLKGSNLCGAWIDEPFIQKKQVFKEIVSRVRVGKSKHSEINLTGTPEELNWGYELCEGTEFKKFDGKKIIVKYSTGINKANADDYVSNIEAAYSKRELAAYRDGEFLIMSGQMVYYAFSDDNIKDIPDEGYELKIGMDFNVNPMAGVVFWTKGKHIHYVDEFEFPNANTQYFLDSVMQKYPGRITECYPDPACKKRATNAPVGKTDATIIRNAGLTLYARGQQGRKDRFNVVNKKLEDGTMTISPKCKKLRVYFKSLAHDKLREPAQEAMTHLLDGATYAPAYLYPITAPIHGGIYV